MSATCLTYIRTYIATQTCRSQHRTRGGLTWTSQSEFSPLNSSTMKLHPNDHTPLECETPTSNSGLKQGRCSWLGIEKVPAWRIQIESFIQIERFQKESPDRELQVWRVQIALLFTVQQSVAEPGLGMLELLGRAAQDVIAPTDSQKQLILKVIS